MAEEDSDGRDLYAVLELARSATDDEIRAAFKTLAIQNHPDKHPGDRKAALRFKRINAAYQVLRDPKKREQYDQLTAPVEDFSEAALARHVAKPAAQVVYETEMRRRKRRVRKRVRSGWSLFVVYGLTAAGLMIVVSLALDHRGTEAGDSAGAAPTTHASGGAIQPPAATPIGTYDRPAWASGEGSGSEMPNHTVAGPASRPIVHSPSADFVGRTVSGDRWELSVPKDWQDSTAPDARGTAWQAPSAVGRLRPSVKVVVKPLPGEPPEYFKDLDRKIPRDTVVDNEAWEYDSKPDGLRREGRIAPEGAPAARFIEYDLVAHGRAYEVTCTGPDDPTATRSLCEPILGSFQVK